jgi:hypothetical protein
MLVENLHEEKDLAGPKNCFIISPIGSEESSARRRADKVLRHIISPAVEARGYTPVRADKISKPGMITSQIIQHILNDPLVIADLTGSNANVYYELALRHAISLPIVQLIEKGERLPFDVHGMRTIFIDHTDLDSAEQARDKIGEQIDSVVDGPQDHVETPISVAVKLSSMISPQGTKAMNLTDFQSTMNDLRMKITWLNASISGQKEHEGNLSSYASFETIIEERRFLQSREERRMGFRWDD